MRRSTPSVTTPITTRRGRDAGNNCNYSISHVALVPAGRCGSSCAVRDHAHEEKNSNEKPLAQRVLDALARTKDDAELHAVYWTSARDQKKRMAEKTREKKERDEAEAKEKEIEAKDEEFGCCSRLDHHKLTDAVGAELAQGQGQGRGRGRGQRQEKGKKTRTEDEEDMEEETGSADDWEGAGLCSCSKTRSTTSRRKPRSSPLASRCPPSTRRPIQRRRSAIATADCAARNLPAQLTQDAETTEIVKTVRGRRSTLATF